MDFRLLGSLEVVDGDELVALGTGRRRALLALLLLNANEVVSMDRIIDGLWGESPPVTANKSVQIYVSELRKAFRELERDSLGELLITRGSGYILQVEPESLDIHVFERALASGKRLLHDGYPAQAAAELDGALGLWRGPPLSDFTYEPFAEREIARLEELRLVAIEARVEAGLAAGDHARLVGELEALVLEHPMREPFQAQLMLALYRCGRQGDALAVYRDLRRMLREELGLEPTRALRDLEQKILAQSPALALDAARERPQTVTSAHESPAAPEPTVGDVLAGYRIEGLLGRGGMGCVYRARQLAMDRQVALKVIAPELADESLVRERFIQESQLAGSIDHPNVLPIYEAGNAGGVLFIAMRLVEGTDLLRLIERSGRLEPRRATAIVAQVAAALDAAHRRGLVHRDVKPANVLIAQDGEEHVYLGDFGLVKRISGSHGITQTGQMVGTLDYVAPEQIRGEPADACSDVYSLGCVLYHALSGNVPFDQDSAVAKMFAHVHQSVPRVSECVLDLPPQLDEVVGRAMAKEPRERYQSAGDLARAARAAVEGSGEARRSTLEGSLPAQAARRRTALRLRPRLLLVIGGLILLATAAAALSQRLGSTEPTAAESAAALLPSICSPMTYEGSGRPRFLIVAITPLQGEFVNYGTHISRALRLVADQREWRAGDEPVALQLCDEADPATGEPSGSRCTSLGASIARNPSVIAVVGPLLSDCTRSMAAILNDARGGPVALISASNTYVGLTRSGPGTEAGEPERYYPGGQRNYVRLPPADDVQGAAAAVFARERGARRVFALQHDDPGFTGVTDAFLATAELLGLETELGVVPGADVDAVFIGAAGDNGPVLVRRMRQAVGPRVLIIGTDAFSDSPTLLAEAGTAAEGFVWSIADVPTRALPAAGRRFAAAFERQYSSKPCCFSVYSAQALHMVLDAIAGSDGSRADVVRQLIQSRVSDGLVGDFAIDRNGDSTLTTIGFYRIKGGRPRFVEAVSPPLRLVGGS